MQGVLSGEVKEAVEEFLKELSKRFRVSCVYVFGSRVRGDWIKTSDIDLVVISRDFEGMSLTRRLDVVNEIVWRRRIRPYIEVIPLTPEEFEERKRLSAVLRDASKYWVKVDFS